MSLCECKMRSHLSDHVHWLMGLLSCSLPRPPMRPPLTGSSGVKGGPPHYSHVLPASSCLHSQHPWVHPSSHPSPPLQPLITDLSCHHTHIRCHTAAWLMRPLLIMASGTGVSALSLDTIRAVLLQRRKTPGRQTGSSVRRYDHR